MNVAILAKALAGYAEAMGEEFHGLWPNDEYGEPVASVTQRGTYTLLFSDPCLPYDGNLVEEMEDVEGLPYINPNSWDDAGETITHAEYEAFLAKIGATTVQEVLAYFITGERVALAAIAEKNAKIAVLVNEIVELAEPFGLEVSIDLGDRGELDLDGPWDSSSAYC